MGNARWQRLLDSTEYLETMGNAWRIFLNWKRTQWLYALWYMFCAECCLGTGCHSLKISKVSYYSDKPQATIMGICDNNCAITPTPPSTALTIIPAVSKLP